MNLHEHLVQLKEFVERTEFNGDTLFESLRTILNPYSSADAPLSEDTNQQNLVAIQHLLNDSANDADKNALIMAHPILVTIRSLRLATTAAATTAPAPMQILKEMLLTNEEEARSFLMAPLTDPNLYELYGIIAHHYRKNAAVNRHINPVNLLTAATNNWETARLVLTSTLFTVFPRPLDNRFQNLMSIYKAHCNNEALKPLRTDPRITLPYIIYESSETQRLAFGTDVQNNPQLNDLFKQHSKYTSLSRQLLLSNRVQAKRFLAVPPTTIDSYELYGVVANHYRKSREVKPYIDPTNLLEAAKNNWYTAQLVLTTRLFLAFPIEARFKNLMDIYKVHCTNNQLKKSAEQQLIDTRATLAFILEEASDEEQSQFKAEIDANPHLTELFKIQLEHAAAHSSPTVRFAEQLEFPASNGYSTGDLSAPKNPKSSLKNSKEDRLSLLEEDRLRLLKVCVENATKEYIDYSNNIWFSLFHRHGNSGRARAKEFSTAFSKINDYTQAKEQLISYLSNEKNGNTYPHSYRTMLMQELQEPPQQSLQNTSKQFKEQLRDLSIAYTINLTSVTP